MSASPCTKVGAIIGRINAQDKDSEFQGNDAPVYSGTGQCPAAVYSGTGQCPAAMYIGTGQCPAAVYSGTGHCPAVVYNGTGQCPDVVCSVRLLCTVE